MKRRTLLKGLAATAAGGLLARPAIAADVPLKIGCTQKGAPSRLRPLKPTASSRIATIVPGIL